MNISNFINSRDVAEHFTSINYHFSALEAAFIVWQSNTATLEERHAAYKEIIETMPDCEIQARDLTHPHKSLHQYLSDYMRVETELIERFFKYEPKAVYSYNLYCEGEDDWLRTEEDLFSSYENCLNGVSCDIDLEPILVLVKKRWMDNNMSYISAYTKPDGTIIKLHQDFVLDPDEDNIFYGVFRGLYFEFPLPFKRGDILTLNTGLFPNNFYSKYFVYDKPSANVFSAKEKNDLCSEHMCAYCYAIDSDGILDKNLVHSYLDCEFFLDSLPKEEWALQILSDLILRSADECVALNSYLNICNTTKKASIR